MGWLDMFSDFAGGFANGYSPEEENLYSPWNPKAKPGVSTETEMPRSEASSANYLNLIDTLGQRDPRVEASNYYDTESPEVKDYLAKASAKPPSEDLLEAYISKQPSREEYKPSIWRTIGSALVGLSAMGDPERAAKNTEMFYYGPLNDKMADWKNEGTAVNTRARLADAARNRDLGAQKFNLENKTKAQRYKSLSDEAAKRLTEKTAGKAVGFQNKDEDQAAKNEQNSVVNSMRELALQLQKGRLDLSREGLDLRKDKEEWDRAHPKATKLVDPLEHETKKIANEDKIKESIKERIMADPKFSQYFDPNTGGFREGIDEKVKSDLLDLVEGEFQKRMIVLRGGK